MDNPELIDAASLRILPIVNTLSLESSTVDQLNTFLESLPQPRDVVVLLEPSGLCTWTSALAQVSSEESEAEIHIRGLLSTALTQNLQSIAPSDVMDQRV